MAETFTRDKIIFKGIRVEWEGAGNARVNVDYVKTTNNREIPVDRSKQVPLNPTRQSQVDMLRDLVVSFILAQEESTEFS